MTNTLKTCLVALAVSTTALAANDVDVFLASKARQPVARQLPREVAELVARGRITNVEPRLGVPTTFFAERSAHPVDLRAAGVTPEQAARRALFTYAPLYKLTAAELAESPVKEIHDTGVGAIIVQFEHRVGTLKVFHERLNVVLSRKLELVAITGAFSALNDQQTQFKLSAPSALAVAFEGQFNAAVADDAFRLLGIDGANAQVFNSTLSSHRFNLVRAQQTLFPDVDGKRLVPAWYVEIDGAVNGTPAELIGTVVSARDGRVLWRHSLTQNDIYDYRVWADPATKRPLDGPNGRATPHPTGNPDGTTVGFVSPSLVSLEHAGISTNDPWLPAGATVTTGNNVEAYADVTAPDGYNNDGGVAVDQRGQVTAAKVFGDTYNTEQGPGSSTQRNAGIAQLFYTVNWLHDTFYDRGFNEAAGNAQDDNFMRGGIGGDSIKAEAQDYGGLNNANMSTPTDGARPRMQMYLWQPDGLQPTVTASSLNLTADASAASFGPANFDITTQAVLAQDGTAPASDGCTTLTNAAALAGKIAVIDRGTCGFKLKVYNAQQAGAVGVIIANNVVGLLTMADDPAVPAITIGTLLLSLPDANTLKAGLASAPAVHMLRSVPAARDGSLDNTVVAHEWGHYLSNRLVPGLGALQSRGMGEGWGDFTALLMTAEAQDTMVASNANFGGVYALAIWDGDTTAFPSDAPYFGIRRVPYSVDFTKDPLTFRNIGDGNALTAGVPVAFTSTNSEVHNTGEVWATMLWECYVALIRTAPRLTFLEARERMERYLVAGLKLTPGNPTFTEARDAMLAAAAAQEIADFRVFAQAFARRGLGGQAVSPPIDSTNNLPLVEDFNTVNDVSFVSATLDDEAFYCDRDGTLDSGERGTLRVTLKNVGIDDLTATTATITSSISGVTFTPSTLTFSTMVPFGTATATTTVALPAGLTAISDLGLTISFNDTALTVAGPRTHDEHFTVNRDSIPNGSATDDAEAPTPAWTFSHDTTLADYDWARVADTALTHHFNGIDASAKSDIFMTSPVLQVGAGPFSFTFKSRWKFEFGPAIYWDGAVIEASTNGGTTWTDIGAQAAPGYNGTITEVDAENPLIGRQVWGNTSAGYPAYQTSTVTLGTTYANQALLVRLRVGTDVGSGEAGMDVDDFVFTGLTNTPFPRTVADRGLCINRPPVANAGADQAVDERTAVTLSSALSTDADNNTLTAIWAQTAGPTVTLTNGTFTAPEVSANTTLTFSLKVNDGTVDSANTDSINVLVRNVNRDPVVTVPMTLTVEERAPFSVVASVTDADADPLTYVWRQVSGPTAAVTGASTSTLSGLAPEVTADALMTFELKVSDGTATITNTVAISVRQVNRPPSVVASGPTWVNPGDTVTLTSLAMDADGDTVTVAWTQTGGPMVALSSATESSTTFVAPDVDTDTQLVFSVIASDGTAQSSPSGITVNVRSTNTPPIAEPGPDVEMTSGETVVLDGTRSRDLDGDSITYHWQQEGEGSRLIFANENQVAPSITAPEVTTRERLSVLLYVRDPSGAVGSATVHVTVNPKVGGGGCGCSGLTGVEPMLLGALLVLVRSRRKLQK